MTPHADTAASRSPGTGVSSELEPCPDVEARELQRLTADISARLRCVCAHMPADEFSALVMEIARVRMRYEQRVFSHTIQTPPRRAD